MGCLDIRVSRLVETDMTIATDTEQLQVDAAAGSDQIIICLAGFLWILGKTVWYKGAVFVDVDMVKEIIIHKIAITLDISGTEPLVFIQVDGGDL